MAMDMFLKLDGLPGESRDAAHKDEIQVESFSWGVSNSGSFSAGGGGGAGKASFQDLSFTNLSHKSSPKLMSACASGEHIKKAVLSLRKAGGDKPQEFIKITLEDVLISSYSPAGAEGGESDATENVSLAFAKIEFSYTEQNADGSPGTTTTEGWDLRANKGT